MSTAGKVLSVLVVLMAIPSIYLLAMVSALNRNQGSAVAALEQSIIEKEQELRDFNTTLITTSRRIEAERIAADTERVSLQLRIEDLRDQLSLERETLARAAGSLVEWNRIIELNRSEFDLRTEEINSRNSQLTQLQRQNAQLIEENTERDERLQMLRSQTQQLIAENQELQKEIESGQLGNAANSSAALRSQEELGMRNVGSSSY